MRKSAAAHDFLSLPLRKSVTENLAVDLVSGQQTQSSWLLRRDESECFAATGKVVHSCQTWRWDLRSRKYQ